MESLMFASGLTSLVLGAAMTLLAWTFVRQNRRREAARAQLLSALAFPGGVPAVVAADDDRLFCADQFQREPAIAGETLFSEPQQSGATSRRTIVLGAIVLMVMTGVGTYRWFAGAKTGAIPAAQPVASATTVTVARPPVAAPDPRVELLALNHTATQTAFVVTGRVRNPVGSLPLRDVIASVHLLDGAGRVLVTVRAPIKGNVLHAGETSDFAATAAKATNVARFRVEFHAKDRQSIPQIDLRQRETRSRSD
jgi:hypothetical protein